MDTRTTEGGVPWAAVTAEAPAFAERVRARFVANLHHVIGTVRTDGSPRLSGTEVAIGPNEVTLGMMPGSRKLADVRRDPRVEIHSAPLEADLAHGDAKLTGWLLETTEPPTAPSVAGSFALRITRVSLVRVADDQLVFTTWDPLRGQQEQRRH